MERRLRMKASLLFGVLFAASLCLTVNAQIQFGFSWQYADASAGAMLADGTTASDFQHNDNLLMGFSFVNSGAYVGLAGNIGQGIARQMTLIEPWRMEVTQFGDSSANATGFEDETASGGGFCNWSHGFTVDQTTPYVVWGRIGTFDSAYTSLRLYQNNDFDFPVIDEISGGAFVYTGEFTAGTENWIQYQSSTGAFAYSERSFRAGGFSGSVFLKINTVLAEELRPQMGIVLSGDVSGIFVSEDNQVLSVRAKELPWNRVNLYVLTLLPRAPGKKLVADVSAFASESHSTFYIRAFNWRTSQWVVAYQGMADTRMTRRLVGFPGSEEDYISPTNSIWRGRVISSVAWLGRYGTQPNWTAHVDMVQMSYR